MINIEILYNPAVIFAVLGAIFLLLAWLQKALPYIPTKMRIVKDIVSLTSSDADKNKKKAVDLGSGDGRIVIELARAGYQAHGYEINPFLVVRSRRKIKKLGLEDRANIHWGNFWKKDLSGYDLVVVYGITYVMQELKEKFFSELEQNAKVICHTYEFKSWDEKKQQGKAFLYIVD
jgi:protein-L-isoaspartate O-methyltransferase